MTSFKYVLTTPSLPEFIDIDGAMHAKDEKIDRLGKHVNLITEQRLANQALQAYAIQLEISISEQLEIIITISEQLEII